MIYENVLRCPDDFDFNVKNLGPCLISAPGFNHTFVTDNDRIAFSSQVHNIFQQIEIFRKIFCFAKMNNIFDKY